MRSSDINTACTSSFRQLYLRKLLRALRSVDMATFENLSILKRRRRIKLAADISLALTANGTVWSHALIANISKLNKDKYLLRKIVGKKKFHSITLRASSAGNINHPFMLLQPDHQLAMQKLAGRRRVLRRYMKNYNSCRRSCPRKISVIPAYNIARNLVNKRTKQLRSLIPGGESMDSHSLWREAADYIISLKTQVEVMHSLANAVQCKHAAL